MNACRGRQKRRSSASIWIIRIAIQLSHHRRAGALNYQLKWAVWAKVRNFRDVFHFDRTFTTFGGFQTIRKCKFTCRFIVSYNVAGRHAFEYKRIISCSTIKIIITRIRVIRSSTEVEIITFKAAFELAAIRADVIIELRSKNSKAGHRVKFIFKRLGRRA